MSRRARTRRDKRAPQPDFDDTTAAYGRFSFGRVAMIDGRGRAQRPIIPAHRGGPCRRKRSGGAMDTGQVGCGIGIG